MMIIVNISKYLDLVRQYIVLILLFFHWPRQLFSHYPACVGHGYICGRQGTDMSYWQNSFVIPDMLLGTLCCMIRELSCFWQRTFLALLVQCVEQGLWNCWASVSPSVFLSHLATTCCCGEFAAVGLAGRRYRLIIARLACNSCCKQCRIVSWRRLVKLAILFCVCTPHAGSGA